MKSHRLQLATLALASAAAGMAQPRATAASAASDAVWTRSYVGSYGASKGDIKWDRRFLPLMRSSFPQHQWFWRDHGTFTPLPQLVQVYLGVPGGVRLDDNRYVTAVGCVPHACTTRGMLWIDTGTHPAKLIFVAEDFVDSNLAYKGPGNLLWIFSSSQLNWQNFPSQFLSSLQQWQSDLMASDRKDGEAWISEKGFLLANFVEPTGQIDVLAPSVLGLKPTSTGAKQ
ncbi:MAG TPA: hypothetical protein VMD97_04500 [Candidatus Aquilonibacter sp.]|nr:hypothetical protein [Candidatus Aquilonibacter sp.]